MNEFDILGISRDEWAKQAKNNGLYQKRVHGYEKDEITIIEDILVASKIRHNQKLVRKLVNARIDRLRKCLGDVDRSILEVLQELKRGMKCLFTK